MSARGFVAGTSKQKQSRQKIMNIICSETFLPYLNKSIAILELIERGIKWFQDDQVSLSMVYKTLGVTMKHAFQDMQCLTDGERLFISKLIAERLCFMYGDSIRISYLLDPVMIGDSMSDAHRNRAETALFDSVNCGIVITEENQDNIDNKKEQLF